MEYIVLLIVVFWVCSAFSKQTPKNSVAHKETKFHSPEGSAIKKLSQKVTPAAKRKPTQKVFAAKKNIGIDQIQLTDEFKAALDVMENSRRSIFLTGKAGTGKSTLLRYFQAKTKKNIAVVAPTGIAAINIGGQTIHSFFRLPPRFVQAHEVRSLGRRAIIAQNLDTLVIDEASMVRADVLDGIDLSLKINRSSKQPFGGVQVIFIGDLFQLPPIVDKDMKDFFDAKYPAPYIFGAKSFAKLDLEYVELTHIFRQSNDRFITLLNKIRENNPAQEDFDLLATRVVEEDFDEEKPFITLTPRNDAADRINAMRLATIDEQPLRYTAKVTGEFKEGEYPNEYVLTLKKGAQIMMIKNDIEQGRWVNGSLGFVEHLSDASVKVNINGLVYEVIRYTWQKIQYTYDEEQDIISPEIIGTFEQFPIKLSWAITIHKSQGQTFDNVILDMRGGAFTHGQVYVALSRCTTLEGMQLTQNINPADIIFDHRVLEFHKKFNRGTQLENKNPAMEETPF